MYVDSAIPPAYPSGRDAVTAPEKPASNHFKNLHMSVTHFLATLCFLLGFVPLSQAQQPVDQMVKEWERAKAYTKEYLDLMPDDKYSLKPTPEMRSFAGQMMHLTDANYLFASVAAGTQSPKGMGEMEKSADQSKQNVIKQVMDGYDYVIATLKQLDPSKMGEQIKMFDRFEMSRGVAFEKAFEHQTHHRGQTTVYLRLAGVKPPQEKLF
jgi:uncharacterized damage-inducible protein DinB